LRQTMKVSLPVEIDIQAFSARFYDSALSAD
jgi:hypothetical protein